jgi:hypothetical protein
LLAVTFSQRGVAPLYPHEVRLSCMGSSYISRDHMCV